MACSPDTAPPIPALAHLTPARDPAMLTRLERNILRLQACAACLETAIGETAHLDGPVFELGLGNGRTYHHLRVRYPERPIYVFEWDVAPHPESRPEPGYLIEGDVRETLPAQAAAFSGRVALLHADVASADPDKSARLAAELAPILRHLLHPEARVVTSIAFPGLAERPLPQGVARGYYFLQGPPPPTG